MLPMMNSKLQSYSWTKHISKRISGRHFVFAAGVVFCLTTLYYIATPRHVAPLPEFHYTPPVVYEADTNTSIVWDSRAEQVKQAFLHAYHGYEKYASPHDELRPVSNKAVDNFNGWGVTVVDSLDTMIIMGLTDEFQRALLIVENIEFVSTPDRQDMFAPFFETVIRYLGGLLSAHAMSHEAILLKRADDLAVALAPAFGSKSGLPLSGVNTLSGHTRGGMISILAEVASCQLEYLYLAWATGKKEHYDKAHGVMKALEEADVTVQGGMFPTRWNIMSGKPAGDSLSMGGAADSGHEYLLKQYLLTAQSDPASLQMYLRTINHVLTDLLYLSDGRELLYVTDSIGRNPSHKFEHLSCFFPGLLALGAHTLNFTLADLDPSTLGPHGRATYERLKPFDLRTLHKWAAEGIATACWLMYADQPTGLGSEEVIMRPKPDPKHRAPSGGDSLGRLWFDDLVEWNKRGAQGMPPGLGDRPPVLAGDDVARSYSLKRTEYFLRPETLESIYLMWQTTRNPVWRERGWSIFKAIEREAKTDSGYASVIHVDSSPSLKKDEMPSYFLAETLKYLYLLFSEDDIIPLDRWVFNTEAHPLPIFAWSTWEKKKFGIP